jgi:hypothetical protein
MVRQGAELEQFHEHVTEMRKHLPRDRAPLRLGLAWESRYQVSLGYAPMLSITVVER